MNRIQNVENIQQCLSLQIASDKFAAIYIARNKALLSLLATSSPADRTLRRLRCDRERALIRRECRDTRVTCTIVPTVLDYGGGRAILLAYAHVQRQVHPTSPRPATIVLFLSRAPVHYARVPLACRRGGARRVGVRALFTCVQLRNSSDTLSTAANHAREG